MRYFCDNAEAVLLLTATPVQLGSDDLFTLLNVLRPDLVIDRASFEQMAEPNRIHQRRSATLPSRATGLATGGTRAALNQARKPNGADCSFAKRQPSRASSTGFRTTPWAIRSGLG